ncbi:MULTISPECIES: MFS transporter [Thermococcus]|nr:MULTISPECIES: MFS transporter [Thermococcus]KUK17301.1 MAG: Putative transporter [Thermococcus sibiricus]KUK28355.1 MAG: Putative transporter [Thermococcus sp. 40_45]MBC7094419.1 MFS transporter [Thermococcus sp.]HII67951.1 MFS transporter [Thermococcaceae archaeon]
MRNLRRKISIVLLVLMAAFLMADQNLLPPNYQQIMAEFGITETQMGLVSTIFVATSALITIVWGFLSDIGQRKKLLVIGVLLGEIPCFLTAYVQNYYQLLAMRFLTGIGIGSIIPIGYSLIADMFEEEKRGRGYAYIETAFGFGTLFGMIVAGLITSWRPPFIIAAVPNFILAPLFYIVAEEPRRGEGEKELKKVLEKGYEYTYRLNKEVIKKSLKTRTNILIFIQGIIGTVPWGIIMYWLVSFFIVTRGMEKSTATFVLLLVGLSTVIGSLLGGFAGDYFEAREKGGRAIITGLAIFLGMIAAIGMIIYPLPSELTLIHWIGLMIYSFVLIQFVSYAGPNVRAIVSQVNLPEDRGTVFGLFNILDNVGKATGPLFGGFLIETLRSAGYSDALAYEYTLLIGALFWIPCAAVWLWIRKSYPEDRDMVKETLKKRAIELSKAF